MGGEDEGAVLPNTSVAFAHFVCNYMNQCCKLSGFKNGRVNSLFWTEHESVFGLVQDSAGSSRSISTVFPEPGWQLAPHILQK